MRSAGVEHVPASRADLTAAVALFRSLADPTRLAIVRRLASGEARVLDLTAELGLPQSTVSSHVACLRERGLIDYRPQGRSSVYRVTHPELIELFAVAESLLRATGEAVALCPTYGDPAQAEAGEGAR
jgi:ArsR family transcriptional regulator